MEHELAKACALVEEALRLPQGSVTVSDALNSMPQWDSLAQLSVVTLVEKRLDRKIDDLEAFEQLTSVPGIAHYLKEVQL